MESWKDLVKLLLGEMNPIEGYNSRPQDIYENNRLNNDKFYRYIFKNNVNKFLEMDPHERSYVSNNVKDLKRVNVPNFVWDSVGDETKKIYDVYEVPPEYVKDANNNLSKVKNRIPTVTMGKMVNKLMSYPAVQTAGKVIEGTATPLMIMDMLKLQGAYPYTQNQYKQILNNMGVQYNNGQIQL